MRASAAADVLRLRFQDRNVVSALLELISGAKPREPSSDDNYAELAARIAGLRE